jgi:hypothetical protein
MADKIKPIHEIRLGAIRVSIWANVNLDGSRWHTITFGRLYKDDQDRWQVAQHYTVQNLSNLMSAISLANDWTEHRSVQPEATAIVKELVRQASERGKKPGGRSL